MKNNKLMKTLSVVFILALLLRLFVVFTQEESKRPPFADAKQYDNIAVNIVSGNGFTDTVNNQKIPTARRTPIYPLFLAGIYSIFGHNYLAVKIVQAVLGALLCILMFFIANLVFDDKNIGIITAVLMAIYAPFVGGFNYYGGPALLGTEYFYMFILGVTILMMLLFIKNGTKKLGVLSGIFLGLTALTRPEFILYPIILGPYLFFICGLSIKKFIKRYAIVYIFIALTMTPWVLRNYIVYKEFVPLTLYHSGLSFWTGNYSLANGGSAYSENYREILDRVKGFSDYEKNRVFFREGMEELVANPRRIPKLLVKKVMVHWAPFEKGFEIFNPCYAVILLSGSIGILFFRKRIIMENILLIIFISTTLITMIICGDPRYRYPYEPYLIIFSALAINETFKKIRVNMKKSTTRCPRGVGKLYNEG